jgi:transposase-like protein
MISHHEWLQIALKTRMIRVAVMLSLSQKFVTILNTKEKVDERKVSKVAQKCINSFPPIIAELDELRSILESLLNKVNQSQPLQVESVAGTLAKIKSKTNKLVYCPTCKQEYDVSEILNVPDFDEDEHLMGQQVKCRNCSFIFTLPNASAFMSKSKKKTVSSSAE